MKADVKYAILFVIALAAALTWSMYRSSVSMPTIPVGMEESEMFEQEYGAKPYNGKKVDFTTEEWKEKLSPEQFYVLREQGTERAFSSKLNYNREAGEYICAGCGLSLFSSKDKYDSGTGWPSFTMPIDPSHVGYSVDSTLFSTRVEVHCNRCQGHLGHVFNDGPKPTGHRYCINGVALEFLTL